MITLDNVINKIKELFDGLNIDIQPSKDGKIIDVHCGIINIILIIDNEEYNTKNFISHFSFSNCFFKSTIPEVPIYELLHFDKSNYIYIPKEYYYLAGEIFSKLPNISHKMYYNPNNQVLEFNKNAYNYIEIPDITKYKMIERVDFVLK